MSVITLTGLSLTRTERERRATELVTQLLEKLKDFTGGQTISGFQT